MLVEYKSVGFYLNPYARPIHSLALPPSTTLSLAGNHTLSVVRSLGDKYVTENSMANKAANMSSLRLAFVANWLSNNQTPTYLTGSVTLVPNYSYSSLFTAQNYEQYYNMLNQYRFASPFTSMMRNAGDGYFPISYDEWLKAGYYKGAGVDQGLGSSISWWQHAAQSDSVPLSASGIQFVDRVDNLTEIARESYAVPSPSGYNTSGDLMYPPVVFTAYKFLG